MLGSFWQDLRHGARVLLKRPGFTLAVALTLALGIGANTAIFSVVNVALLRPLPFEDPDRLIQVWSTNAEEGQSRQVVSVPDFLDWRDGNRSFEQLAAYSFTSFILTGRGEPERLLGAKVSADFFPLLRARPAAGRLFAAEEDRFGAERVAVISHGLWQRRFGADPAVVGQLLRLDNESYRVVGVLPRGFNFPARKLGGTDVWVTHSFDFNKSMSKRSSSYLAVIGRLKEGATLTQARAEMDAVARALAEQHPASNRDRGVYLVPMHEQMVEKARPMLLILFGVVSFLLLVACLNVANLMLANSSARHKEMTIRSALGASRLRLVGQSLTESVLMALVGGGLGLLFAAWGLRMLVALIPPEIANAGEVGLDKNVLAWTFGVSVMTGLLCGIVPALRFSRPDMTESLRESGPAATATPRRGRLRAALIVGEVALSLVLLVCAGLLLKSLWRLQHVEAGFVTDNVLTLSVSLPSYRYPDAERQRAFHARAVERLRGLPGVTAAGMTTILPLSGKVEAGDFQIVGRPAAGSMPSLNSRAVSAEYLRTLGIPLLRGRTFAEADDERAAPVCLINNSMALRLFPGEDPLGQRLKTAGAERQIVGVVGDVKHRALSGEPGFEMYVPYAQYPYVSNMTYVIRAAVDPTTLAPSARAVVGELDPEQTVENIQPMDSVLLKSIAEPRFNTFLLSLFAAVALLIASAGLYGVMSYTVAQRTREIGVRVALGAQRRDVLRLVIAQGMRPALVGAALGVAAAFAASRALSSFLFEVSAADPWMHAAAPLLLLIVALVACYVPARHATRIDPLNALRYD